MNSLKYCVFGLGNKQYEHYNRMGKLTDKLLEEIGANRIFPYAEGDDDNELELDFENWKAQLWPSLVSQFHPDAGDASWSQRQHPLQRQSWKHKTQL